MLIEGYESNQKIQLNSIGNSEIDNNDDYKKLILDLKQAHRNEIGRLKSEIARTEKYRGNFDELNGIKVVFLTIPHGLVVRIRAFHARGRGSIPRGGVFKVEHCN